MNAIYKLPLKEMSSTNNSANNSLKPIMIKKSARDNL
jgi:hypothetical protein